MSTSSSNSLRSEKKQVGVAIESSGVFGESTATTIDHGINAYGDIGINEDDLELIEEHLDELTYDEWLKILRDSAEEHKDDICLAIQRRDFLVRLGEGPLSGQTQQAWEHLVKFEAYLIYNWSIYPEVRAATRPIHDRSEDVEYNTFRAYLLGILWACAACTLDTFFSVRFPNISIGAGAVELLIALSGQLYARLPRIVLPLPFKHSFVINTGEVWSFKEQMLASLIMLVSLGSPYSQSVIIAFANSNFFGYQEAGTFGFTFILTLSTACLGFGVAGILRAFNVYPTKMVWFDTLPTITMSRTLVKAEIRENVGGWILKRYEFFWLFAWIWFGWYWITNFVFQALSYFSWISWIAPDNINLQAITGPFDGLGLNPLTTFDTNVIGLSIIVTPLFAINSAFLGMVFSFFAVVIIWYRNVRYTGFIPINSNTLFNNQGEPYNVSEILSPDTLGLNEERYQHYSLPYFSAGALVNYGVGFIIYPAVIVYSLLRHWRLYIESYVAFAKGILRPKELLLSFDDRFSREMRKYKEAPEWWYTIIMLVSLALSIVTVRYFEFTQCPVWTIFLAVGLGFVFVIPANTLRARTTNFFSINVLIEIIIGYALPGNAPALMVAKAYGTQFCVQADNWNDQQKIAHYAGISPRSIFFAQIISVIATSLCQSGIIFWQVSGALDTFNEAGENLFCTQRDPRRFMCMGVRTYFNAAVQFGTIGPKRLFDGSYSSLKWCFLIGAVYPLPFWLGRYGLPKFAHRFRRNSLAHRLLRAEWLKSFDEIVFLTSAQSWAPNNWFYSLPGYEFAWLFYYLVKLRHPQWWTKYAFNLINAESTGVSFSELFMFFATSYNHFAEINWWGNDVFAKTADDAGTAVRLSSNELPVRSDGDSYFGPLRGQFPQ